MTLEECFIECFSIEGSENIQYRDFIVKITEMVFPPITEHNAKECARFAFGMDIGIRIGMKYKEMQQKEIEQEIKV